MYFKLTKKLGKKLEKHSEKILISDIMLADIMESYPSLYYDKRYFRDCLSLKFKKNYIDPK